MEPWHLLLMALVLALGYWIGRHYSFGIPLLG